MVSYNWITWQNTDLCFSFLQIPDMVNYNWITWQNTDFCCSFLQIPDMVNYSMAGRTYRYTDSPSLFPFGYGLAYTTFQYSDLQLVADQVQAGDPLQGSVVVSNTGFPVACDEASLGN
jgi:hypothetical protein